MRVVDPSAGSEGRPARRCGAIHLKRCASGDGRTHDVDSSETAFKIASGGWFRQVASKARPVLLEPVVSVEVATPDDYPGAVVGDLNSRRGQMRGTERRGSNQVISAQVPLAEMFGYSIDLRSRTQGRATQGRATHTMQFDSYQPTPASVQSEIVAPIYTSPTLARAPPARAAASRLWPR